uniref:GATA-type domain-containing protein n=1 Tax=Globisporangium ultimum (strain ATCC 200006 / CBS 805.95 / DAOM BR144) TaxID=431595 RepID=K3WAP0_GLOUD
MSSTIECTTCGAVGESNFSKNYFGELVCELCGTQSFLQSRNETQEMDDTTLDIRKVSGMKQSTRKKRPRIKKEGGAAEDDDGDGTTPASRRRIAKRKRLQGASLLNCLRATQAVLHYQAQHAMQAGGFPSEYVDVVQEIWFLFLETWERKSSRPLLRCYSEFYFPRTKEDKAMDPAVTQQLLEQWDKESAMESTQVSVTEAAEEKEKGGDEIEDSYDSYGEVDEDGVVATTKETRTTAASTSNKPEEAKSKKPARTVKQKRLKHHSETLDRFTLVDLLGILVLAARVLNLGVLPCDFAYWVSTGELPFHNLLSECCSQELRDAVFDVSLFFDSSMKRHSPRTSRIAYHAHYLQHHLDLRLPPLNVSLVAYNICANLGFPAEVFRHFQWITARFNIKGGLPEEEVLCVQDEGQGSEEERFLDSSIGVVAHLVVAVKMCANWHEWIYERELRRKRHVPPYLDFEALRMPRRELDDFVDFCEDTLVGRERANIPPAFESHVYDLRGKYTELKRHVVSFRRGENEDEDGDTEETRLQDHPLYAYPALYTNGICAENDDEIEERVEFVKRMLQRQQEASTHRNGGDNGEQEGKKGEDVFFYPMYPHDRYTAFHAAYENVLSLLCEYVDTPISTVVPVVLKIDQRIGVLCQDFANNFYRLTKRSAVGRKAAAKKS